MTTTMFRGAFLAALLLAGAAQAQSVERGGSSAGAIPPVSEGAPTGSSPAATGSITSTGKTKPPGAPVGEGMGTRPDLERRAEELDRRIRSGICRGC